MGSGILIHLPVVLLVFEIVMSGRNGLLYKGLDSRAKQVILNYSGTWQPAQLHERAIKGYHTQPVTFAIEDEEETPECDNPFPATDNI